MKIPKPASAVLLGILFSSFYFSLGPGLFFSVDEVVVQEMAQGVIQRGTLEVPAMNTTALGRGGAHYAHRGPALGYIAMPLVAFGNFLDDHFGSWQGGVASGPPLGTLEHPLRWGGRLAIFTALATNAIVGGLAVSVLYLIALQFGATHRIAFLVAGAAGISTLLFSESTHFFQHPLETLMILLGFWFFSVRDPKSWTYNAVLGGLSLGLACLSRPNSLPAATVIWFYGAAVAWRYYTSSNRSFLTRWSIRSLTPIAVCISFYLAYNYLQFGCVLDFGYHDERGRFHFVFLEPLKAIAAYFVSPSLSIFLFAPPLILIAVSLPQALKRWPLETKTLLLASLLHLVLIAFFRTWHGDLSYGPRFMLLPMLLLMPLSIPAFEKAVRHSGWRSVVITVVALGICVQLVGISVFVTVNEWYRNQHNLNENGAFVFIPSASPFLVNTKELLAGRNIIPWAVRVFSQPGPGLLFLFGLISVMAMSCWKLFRFVERSESSRLPLSITIVMASLVALGFFLTSPVYNAPSERMNELVNAGLVAQNAGRDVRAQEYYAIVLGLDASNKYALHNLAVLYEKAGQISKAVPLYERAVASDSKFVPSRDNLGRLQPEVSPGQFRTAQESYEAGKRLWNASNKEGALLFWEAGAMQFPDESWLIRNVALARYELGDYQGAVRDYQRALDLAPDDNGIRTDLAWALLKLNRLEEARENCARVLSVDPSNTAAKAILAQLP